MRQDQNQNVTPQLLQLARRYHDLATTLADNEQNWSEEPVEEQVFEYLVSRDRLAYLLQEAGPPEAEIARFIAQGDRQAKALSKPIQHLAGLEDWRKSLRPQTEAWWWPPPLEKPSTLWKRLDPWWTVWAIICLTLSASFAVNLFPRFVRGGPDILGAIVIVSSSLYALFTTGSVFTKRLKDATQTLLKSLPLPPRLWEEAGAIAATLLVATLWLVYSFLPTFARYYNELGADHYQAGQLASAQYHFERALAFDPNLVQANYNLGVVYEDLNEFEQAKAQYLFAVRGGVAEDQANLAGLDVAYNNLARLYILEKAYDKAIPLLFTGLKWTQDPTVRYDLKKNLGWARLGQNRYVEAETVLEEALELLPNQASAYCLLAQVLTVQESEADLIESAWTDCVAYADASRPDEDQWLGLALHYFNSSSNVKEEE